MSAYHNQTVFLSGLAFTPSFCLQSRVSDPTPSFSDRDAGLPIGEPSAYAKGGMEQRMPTEEKPELVLVVD